MALARGVTLAALAVIGSQAVNFVNVYKKLVNLFTKLLHEYDGQQ